MRFIRKLLLLMLFLSLTSCFYWLRAYQTYLQMDDFDRYFSITASDEFTVNFKEPILYSDDFVSLSKLQPSSETELPEGKIWHYWFRKVDKEGRVIHPEIKFYFDLHFNREDRLIRWSFSSLFLQIAPAEFLEASIRSLGGAKINKEKRQLRANTAEIKKIKSALPLKKEVLLQLGEPIQVEKDGDQVMYHYHFLLETRDIESGYEERALSKIKLTFDQKSQEMIKMSGRFAGLKISINYRKFQDRESQTLAVFDHKGMQ